MHLDQVHLAPQGHTCALRIGTQEQGDQGQFAINGNRSDSNYFSVDGVSANFGITPSSELGADGGGALPALSALGGTNNLVSIDGLQEFRLETSSFAAEFGRGGAQLILVTRSGTNQIHGALFDYLRNDIFDANDGCAIALCALSCRAGCAAVPCNVFTPKWASDQHR